MVDHTRTALDFFCTSGKGTQQIEIALINSLNQERRLRPGKGHHESLHHDKLTCKQVTCNALQRRRLHRFHVCCQQSEVSEFASWSRCSSRRAHRSKAIRERVPEMPGEAVRVQTSRTQQRNQRLKPGKFDV